jgi:hypothetical protein
MPAFAGMTGLGCWVAGVTAPVVSGQLLVVGCQKVRKAWMAAFAAMTGLGGWVVSGQWSVFRK